MEDSNRSSNPGIHELSDPARRTWLRSGAGLALGGLIGPLGTSLTGAAALAGCASGVTGAGPLLGFRTSMVRTRMRSSSPGLIGARQVVATPSWSTPFEVTRPTSMTVSVSVLRS